MKESLVRSKFTYYKEHYYKNIKLAYPVMISQLGHTLVALSDSVIMGRKGTVSLAAVSLANAVFSLILIVGIGISYGLTPLIAQHAGRKEAKPCAILLKNSLFVNFLTGLILFGLSALLSHFLYDFGQSVEVARQSKVLLLFLGFSIVPLMFFLSFKQFAEGLGFTKQAMQISILGNILNILLGITLVFGLFGIHPFGIRGIGISTLTDRILMAVSMGLFVFGSKYFKDYTKYFSLSPLSLTKIKSILSIGIPVAMQYIFEMSAFAGAAIMIGWINPTALAAHQIALSLASITYMMASGLASAATIHIGNHFGSSNFKALRDSAIGSYHMVIFFMILWAFVFIAFRSLLPRLYIHDENVIHSASILLIVAGLFQLFDGLQVVGLGILRGISDVKIPTLITFISYWLVGLPSGFFINYFWKLGALGIWIGLSLGLITASGLILWRFRMKIKALI